MCVCVPVFFFLLDDNFMMSRILEKKKRNPIIQQYYKYHVQICKMTVLLDENNTKIKDMCSKEYWH